MKIISALRHALVGPPDEPGDALARLLTSAQEDAAFRRQIIPLLQLPTAQRESVIHTAVHEMRLRGESAATCAAFATLATDKGATIALRVLNQQ